MPRDQRLSRPRHVAGSTSTSPSRTDTSPICSDPHSPGPPLPRERFRSRRSGSAAFEPPQCGAARRVERWRPDPVERDKFRTDNRRRAVIVGPGLRCIRHRLHALLSLSATHYHLHIKLSRCHSKIPSSCKSLSIAYEPACFSMPPAAVFLIIAREGGASDRPRGGSEPMGHRIPI